jgi:single-stranded DNA-binding protein
MNCFFVSGRVVTEPTSAFIKNDIFIVKFCISCVADYMQMKDQTFEEPNYNFFQCVAFGDVAKQIVEYFEKGTKVSVQAVVENFLFKDSNGTPHFTNVLLVNQIEYNDNVAESFKLAPRKKNMDKVMVSELARIDELFKEVCEKGFLCINESDYYNLAISNMVI